MDVSQLCLRKTWDEVFRLDELNAVHDSLEVVEVLVVLDGALHEARRCAARRTT